MNGHMRKRDYLYSKKQTGDRVVIRFLGLKIKTKCKKS